jgi:hypothetical protein
MNQKKIEQIVEKQLARMQRVEMAEGGFKLLVDRGGWGDYMEWGTFKTMDDAMSKAESLGSVGFKIVDLKTKKIVVNRSA